MGRKTQYNRIATPEKMALINPENIKLKKEFLSYLSALGRSKTTLKAYESDLNIIFVYLLDYCDNAKFSEVKKRQWIGMQSWLINTNGNSPARVRRVKATGRSLSNFITDVLQEDEEPGYENFRPSLKTIESPPNEPVREKTVLSQENCDFLLRKLVEEEQYEKACAFALAIFGGRRKSELLRFKVEHFNDDHLICNGALYSTIETIKSKGRGVNGKQIVAYTLAKPFKPYFDMWMNEREKLGIKSKWLFPNRSNMDEHRTVSNFDDWADYFSALLTEEDGKDVYFYWHSCRHRMTTYLSEMNVPDEIIRNFFNWSDASMVRVYCDIDYTDKFADYFTPDGIKGAEAKSFNDL